GADVGDQIPYERVVRRLAATFAEMEKQNEYLSQDGRASNAGRRPIESLLEIVKEDLNNYGECMIPVGESADPPHPGPSGLFLPPAFLSASPFLPSFLPTSRTHLAAIFRD